MNNINELFNQLGNQLQIIQNENENKIAYAIKENDKLRNIIKNQNKNLRAIASMLQKMIDDSEANLNTY